jgi:hypothetical protein
MIIVEKLPMCVASMYPFFASIMKEARANERLRIKVISVLQVASQEGAANTNKPFGSRGASLGDATILPSHSRAHRILPIWAELK